MTVVYPIIALADGEVLDPQWILDITDAVNEIATGLTPVTIADSSVVDGTTTSATFVNTLTTTTTRGTPFVVPSSGKVLVTASAGGRNNTGGQYSIIDFEIRAGSTIGSGTLLRSSDENTCSASMSDSANQQISLNVANTLVSGLTPGAICHAVLTYRVTSGTGTFNRRKVTVQPTL